MQKLFIAAVCLCMLAGCATNRGMGDQYRPIVDMKNVEPGKFETDLAECQAYARETAGAGQGAAAGAIGGALLGALLQAAAGGGYSRNRGAAVGAVAGGASGAAAGERNQRSVTMRCLQGRGYNVLN